MLDKTKGMPLEMLPGNLPRRHYPHGTNFTYVVEAQAFVDVAEDYVTYVELDRSVPKSRLLAYLPEFMGDLNSTEQQ